MFHQALTRPIQNIPQDLLDSILNLLSGFLITNSFSQCPDAGKGNAPYSTREYDIWTLEKENLAQTDPHSESRVHPCGSGWNEFLLKGLVC